MRFEDEYPAIDRYLRQVEKQERKEKILLVLRIVFGAIGLGIAIVGFSLDKF